MNARKTRAPKPSNSTAHGKGPTPPQNIRATAREMLCSSSKVLTDREKIVLHSLSQGLSGVEIANRLQRAHRVEITKAVRKIRGGARSLSLISASGTSSAQDNFTGPHPGLRPPTHSFAGGGAQDANAS